MELWELAAREAIRDNISRYAHLVDRGAFEEVVRLFAPDGVLEVRGEEPVRGRDALLAFFRGVGRDLVDSSAVPMIRHHVSGVTIDLREPAEAAAHCYFAAYTERGLDHWGKYDDLLVPGPDGWLFEYRRVKTDGTAPGGWAASRV